MEECMMPQIINEILKKKKTATATKLNHHYFPLRKIKNKIIQTNALFSSSIFLKYSNWKWGYFSSVYTEINSYLCEKQISCWKTWLLNIGRREISDTCRSLCHICPTDSCKSPGIPSRTCRRGSLRTKGRFRERAAPWAQAPRLTAPVRPASRFWISLTNLDCQVKSNS